MASPQTDPSSRRAEARVGASICGRYRLLELVGVGGMGAVYAAKHRNGHSVAVKILHERFATDPDVERLFRREAQLSNEIQHPGIVPVIDDDVAEDGALFLVMPLLDGDTLTATWEAEGRKLAVTDVVAVAHAVLDALSAAHARKIVHRDIKPGNIFLLRDGGVRVLDFGVARLFESDDPVSASLSGHAIGTPAFMAPEQALGRRREIDGRTDLWALGATMFSLLAGRYVHQAETASEMLAYAATRPAPSLASVAPHVHPALCAVIDRALAFDRAARWEDAAAMERALLAAYATAIGRTSAPAPKLAVSPPLAARAIHAAITELPTRSLPSASIADSGRARSRHALTRSLPGTLAAGIAKRRFVVASAIAIAIAAGAYFVPRARVAATAAATPSPAASHYEAAVQAWEEAAFEPAGEEFEAAARLDPTFAPAHLRCVLGNFWLNDAAREHYQQAVRYRQRLSASDAALLEAYEPMLREVPDIGEAISRLDAASRRWQNDVFALHVLAVAQMQAGKFDDAEASIDRMTPIGGSSPVALATRGIVASMSGKYEEAKRALESCVTQTPRATNCWYSLLRLETNGGECAEAEKLAHRALTIDTEAASFERFLAEGIHGRGGPIEAVRTAIRDSWAGDTDSPHAARDGASLDILEGDATGALSALDLWSKRVEPDRYAKTHIWPEYRKGQLLLELGRTEEAAAVATSYLRHKDAWLPGDYSDDWINLVRLQYFAGALDKDGFARVRDEWLRAEATRASAVYARPLQWFKAYAFAVVTRADAEEALATLADFGPLPAARSADQEDGVGYTYLTAGRPMEALPYLKKAARACTALDWPMEQTWAQLHYASALEAVGDAENACREYGAVASRWEKMPSKSAALARSRQAALHCSSTPDQ